MYNDEIKFKNKLGYITHPSFRDILGISVFASQRKVILQPIIRESGYRSALEVGIPIEAIDSIISALQKIKDGYLL